MLSFSGDTPSLTFPRKGEGITGSNLREGEDVAVLGDDLLAEIARAPARFREGLQLIERTARVEDRDAIRMIALRDLVVVRGHEGIERCRPAALDGLDVP